MKVQEMPSRYLRKNTKKFFIYLPSEVVKGLNIKKGETLIYKVLEPDVVIIKKSIIDDDTVKAYHLKEPLIS